MSAKQIVAAAGITFQKLANTVTETMIPAHMIMKSLTDQNHSFTLALRLSGYIYVFTQTPPYVATLEALFMRPTALEPIFTA